MVTILPSQVYVTTAASPAIGHANVLTRSVMAVVVVAVVVGAGGGRGGDGRAAGCGNGGDNDQRSWRSAAPSPGTYNGKAFHWCAKCNRWTTTHTTATHKKKSEADASPAANFSLLPDPSAWHAGFGSCRKIFGIFSECKIWTHLWFRHGGLLVLADSLLSLFGALLLYDN